MSRRKSRFDELVISIVRDTGLPMGDVTRVLKYYNESVCNGIAGLPDNNEPVLFGIQKLDAMIRCYPGITLLYSQSDLGKTSFLKSIALALYKQGLTVLYLDAENKMYLHELSEMEGVYFTTTASLDAAKKLIESNMLDVIIVDTISSIPANTMKAFMVTLRKYVPFIILAAQMRVDIEKHKSVPACSDGIQSTAHTHIFLTESEKISFESLDMRRVQFAVMKYEKDVSVERKRSSAVIRDNYVSNFWSAVDHLHSIGMIRALGQNKYLDGESIGKYRDIINDLVVVDKLLELTWDNLNGSEADTYVYRETGRILQQLRTEDAESERGNSPTDEEESVNSYGDRLSDY